MGTLLTIISPVSGSPVTLSKSTNAHFPDTSKSTLQYTFRVTRDEEDTPEIHYSIDEIINKVIWWYEYWKRKKRK